MTATEELLHSARQATDGEHQNDYGEEELRRLVTSLADALATYKSPSDIVRAALWIAAEQPHHCDTLPSALRARADALFGQELVNDAIKA